MRKGFTILELLIVIAVIAIIVGIALPRFKGMQDEGNITRAKAELRTLQTAVESYFMHNNNTLPAALANLIAAGTQPKIVTTLPTDPFNVGNNYGYITSTNGQYFAIYSVGVAGNGSVSGLTDAGVVTETNGATCIYVTNGTSTDTQP